MDVWKTTVGWSNIEFIQRCQNIALPTIAAAYRYDRDDIIHRDKISHLRPGWDYQVCPQTRVDPVAIQLFDNSQDIKRLKHRRPYD